jgi:hypothetical protein
MNPLSLPTTMVEMPKGVFFIILHIITQKLLLIPSENKLCLHAEMK